MSSILPIRSVQRVTLPKYYVLPAQLVVMIFLMRHFYPRHMIVLGRWGWAMLNVWRILITSSMRLRRLGHRLNVIVKTITTMTLLWRREGETLPRVEGREWEYQQRLRLTTNVRFTMHLKIFVTYVNKIHVVSHMRNMNYHSIFVKHSGKRLRKTKAQGEVEGMMTMMMN